MPDYDTLDRETLVRLLQRRDAERQLGLVWERDEIEADSAINSDFVALTLDPALSHGDAPWDNLIIEGDNFDALRALRASHKGAIRCIYIDPPYNTGNRDFVYNDRFVDRTHRFRHSLWLEFMYQRLSSMPACWNASSRPSRRRAPRFQWMRRRACSSSTWCWCVAPTCCVMRSAAYASIRSRTSMSRCRRKCKAINGCVLQIKACTACFRRA